MSEPLAGCFGGVPSYNLLFPDAQLLLQALATFVEGAPIDGLWSIAISLGLPAGEVLDLISHLVARSVVARAWLDRSAVPWLGRSADHQGVVSLGVETRAHAP